MTRTLAPIAALLLSIAILLLGNGLLGTLIPLRANIEAFPGPMIGAIGSAYFAGFAAACLLVPYVVRRVGHIRSFLALTALASAAPLAHLLLIAPGPWLGLRAITGFCMAGIYMVIESWLNERASNANRGLVLSVYTVVNLSAMTGGQLLLFLFQPSAFELFALGSVLVSLAALPVAMTTTVQPAPIASARLHLRRLYAASPVGVVGCFAVGMANGPFWTLGPVFAQDAGLGTGSIALFMAAVIIGGAALQWPFGRLSDSRDRRGVILALALAAALAGALLVALRLGFAVPGLRADNAMLIGGFLFGGLALPLYAISVAHANDFIEPAAFTEASGGLLLAYGIGAALGPVLASSLSGVWGSAVIFAFTAAVHLAFALFVVWRMLRRRPGPVPAPEAFVAMPRTTPAALALDPRTKPMADGEGGREPGEPGEDE